MEKLQTTATVLIVPGLRDHVADHWQTLLASRLAKVRSVPPLKLDGLCCNARVEAIQRELEQIDGQVLLVAHSAGVLMVAHWAARYRWPIKGLCWLHRQTSTPNGRRTTQAQPAWPPRAGRRCQPRRCRSRALSRPAAMTTWPATPPLANLPTVGAVNWSTWVPSAISTRLPVSALAVGRGPDPPSDAETL